MHFCKRSIAVFVIAALFGSPALGYEQAESLQYPFSNGTKAQFDSFTVTRDFAHWVSDTSFSGYHLAKDLDTPYGTKVYAVSDGIVMAGQNEAFGGYGTYCGAPGYVAVTEAQLPDGTIFTVVYGHLQNGQYDEDAETGLIPKGSLVKKGQYLGRIAHYWADTDGDGDCDDADWRHLHFGINLEPYQAGTSVKGYGSTLGAWVDPVDFIENHLMHGEIITCAPEQSAHYHLLDGKKWGIVSEAVYFAQGWTWDIATKMSCSEIDAIPSAGSIGAEGSLMRTPDDGAVWYIHGGKRHHIQPDMYAFGCFDLEGVPIYHYATDEMVALYPEGNPWYAFPGCASDGTPTVCKESKDCLSVIFAEYYNLPAMDYNCNGILDKYECGGGTGGGCFDDEVWCDNGLDDDCDGDIDCYDSDCADAPGCVSAAGCTPNTELGCDGGDVYWFNSCGSKSSTNPVETCGSLGCTNGACNAPTSDYVYPGALETCNGPVTGCTEDVDWVCTCNNPTSTFDVGDTAYAMLRIDNVMKKFRVRAKWYYNGQEDWQEVSGWYDVGDGGWGKFYFWPHTNTLYPGSWTVKMYIDTGFGFKYLDQIDFSVNTPPCTPSCNGKECGSNGCGGSCGSCNGNETCNNGQCVCQPDCAGKTCGDNGCGGSCGSCSSNKACDNGQCICQPDCAGKACGDDGCGGSCGSCSSNKACDNGQCVCQPNCAGKACGDDGCGGSCGSCGTGYACLTTGTCKCIPKCYAKMCGSDSCGGSCGSCNADEICVDSQCVCKPDCAGKECGEDGCGGSCGTCGTGGSCADGVCEYEPDCVPNCTGKECGSNGCGGSCGSCNGNKACDNGQCVCQPDCAGKACGDDGCGGECGICMTGATCIDAQCLIPEDVDASYEYSKVFMACPTNSVQTPNGQCDAPCSVHEYYHEKGDPISLMMKIDSATKTYRLRFFIYKNEGEQFFKQ